MVLYSFIVFFEILLHFKMGLIEFKLKFIIMVKMLLLFSTVFYTLFKKFSVLITYTMRLIFSDSSFTFILFSNVIND